MYRSPVIDDRTDRIKPDSPKNLWEQVRDDIAADIASGVLQAGEKLSGEHELEEMYGVSRRTVRRALEELGKAGLTVTVHGRGTWVAEDARSGDTGN